MSSARLRVVGPDGQPIGVVSQATTAWTRMVGLLGHRSLAAGDGLLLEPAWSIHTWFMRFPIDVIFLDADRRVTRVCPALPAWRMASGTRRARTVLEFGAGTLDRVRLSSGDLVTFEH